MVAVSYFQSKSQDAGYSETTKYKLVKEMFSDQNLTSSKFQKNISQTYYIDKTNGDNSADGTSIESAWKDFSKIKNVSFAQGDRILLKRGEIWNQPLYVPAGGIENKPIIIDAYGNGNMPVIDIRNNYLNGIKIYHSNIVINNLMIQNSIKNCIAMAKSNGLKNIRLNNLKIYNAGLNGIAISKGGTNLQIINCYIENAKNNGIVLEGSAENKLSNVIVRDCHIKKIMDNDGITIHQDSYGNTAGSNFLLQNNIAEMCAEQGFDITTGKNVLLVNNISDKNKQGGILVGQSAKNVTIKRHISTNEPTEKKSAAINLQRNFGNIRLLKSIIKGNGYHLLLIKANNVAVFNNNFIWNGGSSPVDVSGEIDNIYFINNIILSKQNKMSRIRFLEASRPPNHKSFYFNYNIYHVPGKDVVFYYNKKNYNFKKYQKTFKVGSHSLNINPEFVNSSGHELKIDSPAIDKGCFLTHPVSQITPNKVVVQNTLFFYKNFNFKNRQSIMFKGINETFNVIDVDYNNRIITLDKNINVNQNHLIGLNYKNSALDIGAYEFIDLSLPID
ncbi:right-handed parallel beta-helix repeat-containing protein [Desulfobacula phenolica]|uniref:right-handed parallel beta-helix repeat-containing protein n=1 Tax=Desulfobacula phenolica TaxID=90732 RepID=UPI001587DA9D|nr:right-handed parallel beta-helix repeat-containing protein [Desulfobacula phenolica]